MNSCFVSFTFLFLVCFSDSSASLYLFHLFWREQLNSKNRGRDDSWSFLVFYEYFPMVWITPWKNAARPARTKRPALFR